MSDMWVATCRVGRPDIEASMSEQSQLVYRATVGMDTCKGKDCGTHLAYQPNVGEDVECPHCHTMHTIIDGGLLELKETLKSPKE